MQKREFANLLAQLLDEYQQTSYNDIEPFDGFIWFMRQYDQRRVTDPTFRKPKRR